jgi:hypothetical protein
VEQEKGNRVNRVNSVNEPIPVENSVISNADTSPATADDAPTYASINEYTAILGMTTGKAIKIWRKQGSPVIHLGPQDNVLDLEDLLSQPNVTLERLKAIKDWLEKHMTGDEL